MLVLYPVAVKAARPEDWTQVVRENHANTKAWVAASSEPCLTVRDEEVEHVKRILSGADFENLPDQDEFPESWLVAIIVCPDDDLRPVIQWAKNIDDEDIDRVQFYHHPDADVETITTPWLAAGFPEPYTYEVEDFSTFHNRFGWEFNDQVYRDETGWKAP